MQAGIAQTTLHFTDDTAEAVKASDYLFICVDTPAAADGSTDLQHMISVAESIAAHTTNERQKQKLAEQITARLSADLTGRNIEL